MTDTEDDDGLQYDFPGYPVIPLCVRDEFAFEGLDTRNERDRKKIKDAWSHALEKTSHPLLSGYFIGHFVRWNPAAELYALEYVFKTKPEWRDPAKWPELRKIANANSEWMGGTAWTTERWTECCREVLRILPMDEADRDDAMEVWGEAGDKGGRPASRKTTDAQRVMDALNVTADRAYKILRRGTGKLELRVALAGAFADDPTRNTPAAWELKNGSSWGGARRTFGEFCLKGIDPWEDDTHVLTVVRGLLERGTLSINPTFEELAYTVKPTGTDATDLVDLWSRYKEWRAV